MAEFIPFDADNVVGLRVNGKLSEAELENITDVLEANLDQNEKLRLYVEIASFGGMEPKAFLEDLKFGLKHWDRFEKEAVVTDTIWLKKVASSVGKLFPDLEVRTFPLTEKHKAEKWIVQ